MKTTQKELQVLLVEDTAPARKIIETFLKTWGCQVSSAVDGESAYAQSQGQRFDLVYMDLGLPDIDGIDLAKKILSDAKNPNKETPIIGLTADASQDRIQACIAVGMKDVYKKPLSQDMHQQAVHSFCSVK